jgi:DnaJ-class molecular chaperone
MEDPYKVLGVEREASAETIRAAYRKLAKRHHPDLNPGKKDAEERFKAINAAYAILGDAEKRARFDRGEIDASGAERPAERRFYRDFADAAGRAKYRSGAAFDPDDLEGIFGQIFRERGFRGGEGGGFKAQGPDAHFTLAVGFVEAANGALRRLVLPDGRVLDVTIPAGLKDGQVLRLKAQGMPGLGGGPPGDALIEVSVAPHPLFRREGNDVVLELPVTLKEAVLGAKVRVPTVRGPVNLAIPPHSGSGTRLRLKGRGILGGDQYVVLKLVQPPGEDAALAEFLKGWTPRQDFDPRAGMGSP